MRESRSDDRTGNVWDRMPGESNLWYSRFEMYRMLGPKRSIAETYRHSVQGKSKHGKKPSWQWSDVAREWQWRERAEAWDHAERERVRVEEQERRIRAHEQRVRMINVLLGVVFHTLQGADLEGMDSAEARGRLPAIRLLFKDLMNAQRTELGMPADADDGDTMAAPFTADELLAAQRELEEWQRGERAAGNGSESISTESINTESISAE